MTSTTRSETDLKDVLNDALDEFEAENVDLGSLVRDVGGTIDEMTTVSNASLIGDLRAQWKIIGEVDEQRRKRGDRLPSEAEVRKVNLAIASIRRRLDS